MMQGFTTNWDSSLGKLAYCPPPSTLLQLLKKKRHLPLDPGPWSVSYTFYVVHMRYVWGYTIFVHVIDVGTASVPSSPLQPISFFTPLSRSLLNKWKKKPKWCHTPYKDLHGTCSELMRTYALWDCNGVLHGRRLRHLVITLEHKGKGVEGRGLLQN